MQLATNLFRIMFPAAALAMLAMMTMPPAAHAQVIEEDAVYSTPGKGDFFGRVSAVSSFGGSTQVLNQALQVGYDTSFAGESGRFYFSGLGSNTELDLDLELRSSCRTQPRCFMEEGGMTERNISIKENVFDVRDAFIQFDLPGSLEVALGRRRIAWGQFDLFSPINLALPITPQSAEPVIDKISSLVAQDQIGLAWFPGERVEIQAYHFYSTRLDPLVKKFIDNNEDEEFYDPDSGTFGTRLTEQNDVTDHEQSAARIVFYPSWGIFGFTYLTGRDSLSFGADLATLDDVISLSDSTIYNVSNHTDLPEAKSYGFELAIPSGNWVWKFEYLLQESFTDIGDGYSLRIPKDFLGSDARAAFYDAVADATVRGADADKLYIPIDRTLIAFGADAETDNWRFNLSLLVLDETYSEADERLLDLDDRAFGEIERGTLFAPTFNIARYMGGNKQKELGVLAGFLGTYFGGSLYYTSTIGDNFRWTLGAEAFSNLRDDLAADTNPRGGSRYELADDISAGGRFSFIYNF
ncbi:MAG: hypothetical protein OD918_11250 [Gammaproteobacteria bacterium]